MFIKLGSGYYKASELLKIEKAGDMVIFIFDNKNMGTLTRHVDELVEFSSIENPVNVQLDEIPNELDELSSIENPVNVELDEIPFVKKMLNDKIYIEISKDNIIVANKISYMQIELFDGDIDVVIHFEVKHYGSLATRKTFSNHDDAEAWMERVLNKRFDVLK